jgi:hypothetical protein
LRSSWRSSPALDTTVRRRRRSRRPRLRRRDADEPHDRAWNGATVHRDGDLLGREDRRSDRRSPTGRPRTRRRATLSTTDEGRGPGHRHRTWGAHDHRDLLGRSGSTTLTVSSAALVSIEVTPTNPRSRSARARQFAATGVHGRHDPGPHRTGRLGFLRDGHVLDLERRGEQRPPRCRWLSETPRSRPPTRA